MSTQWIAPIVQSSPSRSFICSSVSSGSLAIRCFNACPCSGSTFAFLPQYLYLGLKSHVLFLCLSSFFTSSNDTLNLLASSSLLPSFPSYASTILSL
ncbi:MAG: hypothetical protein LBI02_09630 [Opitutaceae bacterium]|nr:hypothetical protein [Opitutaceae bacterium]